MDSNFRFFRSVDPTKIPCRIKDKFSKLTLSSKKINPQDAGKSEVSVEARKQRPKSLAKELMTDDESESEAEVINKMLQSSDSKTSSEQPQKISDEKLTEKPRSSVLSQPLQMSDSDETNCSDGDYKDAADQSVEMDKLELSIEEKSNLTSSIAALIDKYSSLGIESAPITISSASSELRKHFMSSPKSQSEISQIVSTESQRMSTGHRNPSEFFIETKVAKPAQTLNATAYTISSGEDEDEMQDEEDEESDEEEVIVLDSESEHSVPDKTEEYESHVSDILQSGQVDLPSTASNAKADRLEAFLLDVARARINWATADTESMTEAEDVTEIRPEAAQNNLDTVDTLSFSASSQENPNLPIPSSSLTIAETSTESNDEAESSISNYPPTSTSVSDQQRTPTVESSKNTPTQSNDIHPSGTPLQPVPSTDPSESELESDEYVEKISVSAKISVKIKYTENASTESEESVSRSSQRSSTSKKSSIISTRSSIRSRRQSEVESSRSSSNVEKITSRTNLTTPKRTAAVEKCPQEDEVDQAEFQEKAKLLTKLYGQAWQTPEVVKSLRTSGSGRKSSGKKLGNESMPEESVLVDDFSIFRSNIPNNLESTRMQSISPKCSRVAPRASDKNLKNERKKSSVTTDFVKPEAVKTTKTGRQVKNRYPKLVDSDTDEETAQPKKKDSRARRPNKSKDDSYNKLVYLDLTKEEVEIQGEISKSPPANNDKEFNDRLQRLFDKCPASEPTKNASSVPIASTLPKSKRKLFTPHFGSDNEGDLVVQSPRKPYISSDEDEVDKVKISMPLPKNFGLVNKQLETVKTGKPIFKINTPKTPKTATKKKENIPESPFTPGNKKLLKTPTSTLREINHVSATPGDKYGFLRSLDAIVSKAMCHPDALFYREHYKTKKNDLAQKLYELYNEKCFNKKLDVPLVWNKKLLNTAGRCTNKKKGGVRFSVIELSEKVLTSADRLRCTLIHELCHAATWVFDAEHGHGATWKTWASKANTIFPELPKIGVCHQYDIEYKYTYKCTLCGARSNAHSKSRKVDNIRCSFCHGAIEVFLNKKDKDGNIVPTPVREPKGFAKFVKDNYKRYKSQHLKHANVMKLLSNAFAESETANKKNG